MRYSKFFGKTQKTVPSDATLVSHQLLHQAGFIRESVAGRYFFLPLGQRVQNKLVKLVKEEMDKAGAQEMLSPVLHPLELWEETNRNNAAGFELMQVKDRRGADFALGGTAEEMFVDVVRKFQISYKDLPFNIYQFSLKFRDELRARGGLLRVREFIMKDAYSFHTDEEDFKKEYQNMWDTYTRIFERLGLKAAVVPADGGYIGGDYCHEFVVDCEAGESTYFVSEDGKYIAHEDIAEFTLEEVNPDEEVLEMVTIHQPEWVQTMEDNEKHYGKDARFYLKNVVYKNSEGDLFIVTLRGDLDVNTTKLKNLLCTPEIREILGEVKVVADLEAAEEEDLKAIGTKTGFVHSWGHDFIKPRKAQTEDRDCKVIYIADNSLKTVRNFIGGQKEKTTDTRNVNYGRDFKHTIEGDVAVAKEGFLAPSGSEAAKSSKLIEKCGVEVGNIFQLGYHYSSKMKNADFIGDDGRPHPFYMGCYGIGIGRTLATIVEKFNDEKGIIWPKSVSPFQIHLVSIGKSDELKDRAEKLYQELMNDGFEVLFDDRKESPGIKLNDADLIGIPLRVVISERTLEKDSVEWKERTVEDSELVDLSELSQKVKAYWKG